MSTTTTTSTTTITGDVYIGLDIGTQSTKAILYHFKSSQVLCRASVPYDLEPNPNNVVGRAEQDPNVWINAVEQCLCSLSNQYDLTGSTTTEGAGLKVKGLGVSGQQHGMVPLTSNLKPIRNAKLWCDVEASDEAKTFSIKATELMGKEWDIPPGFTAPKVLWLKHNERTNYDKMRWCVLPHDYVNLMLRGGDDDDDASLIPTTDAGDASGTGIFDPTTRQYVPDLAKIIGNEYYNSLPQILDEPNAISGYLSSKWKARTNIDPENRYPIPISAGSGDNMMSALGTTCVKPGMAVLSLGTSGTIFGISNDPVQNGTPVAPFCDATGRHLPLVCVMSCTGVLQSVLDTWCDGLSHLDATKLAWKVKPGCEGLTFLPYLGGERTPNWPNAKGALLGLTPSNMDLLKDNRAGIMYRAAMEGITYLLADAMETIKTACGDGFRPTSLLVVGGGSKNKLWRQMIADVLNLELRFPLESESAALGAAFQAGAAAEHKKVEEYVMEQNIDMEDCIVRPTEDEETLELYKAGMCRYLESSRKLFQ